MGKALGVDIGGYIAGDQPLIDLLRQQAWPYLFFNSLLPSIVAAALATIQIVENADDLRQRLFDNSKYWRLGLQRLGFRLLDGGHPIVPVMLADAYLAQDMSVRLFAEEELASALFSQLSLKEKRIFTLR